MPMPNREQILTALWALERQLPQLLGVDAAQQLQMQLDPLARSLSRGQSDGTALIQLITQSGVAGALAGGVSGSGN
jgi:hypothetical protein